MFLYLGDRGYILFEYCTMSSKEIRGEKLTTDLVARHKDFDAIKIVDATVIEESCFSAFKKLRTIVLSDSVTHIHRNAFAGCVSLTGTMLIGPNVVFIGADAFKNTDIKSLSFVDFSENVKKGLRIYTNGYNLVIHGTEFRKNDIVFTVDDAKFKDGFEIESINVCGPTPFKSMCFNDVKTKYTMTDLNDDILYITARETERIKNTESIQQIASTTDAIPDAVSRKLQPDITTIRISTTNLQSDTKSLLTDTKSLLTDTKSLQSDTKSLQSDTKSLQSDMKSLLTDTNCIHSDTKTLLSTTDSMVGGIDSLVHKADLLQSTVVKLQNDTATFRSATKSDIQSTSSEIKSHLKVICDNISDMKDDLSRIAERAPVVHKREESNHHLRQHKPEKEREKHRHKKHGIEKEKRYDRNDDSSDDSSDDESDIYKDRYNEMLIERKFGKQPESCLTDPQTYINAALIVGVGILLFKMDMVDVFTSKSKSCSCRK